MKKWIIIPMGVAVLGLAVAGVLRFRGEGTAAQEVPKSVESGKKALPLVMTEVVKIAPISRKARLTGSVVASKVARIASPGEGPVQDCRVLEGDRVRRGDKMLAIGRTNALEAQVSASREALWEQEEELRRIEQLVRSGAIPGAQLDSARAKHQSALAQFVKARESAEDYVIKAPWDGIVAKVHVTDGDYVAPRTVLVEIFDPASLVVRFAVPEAQSTEMGEKMPVTVTLDAYPGKTFNGRVSRVFPELDLSMRTRTVEAVIDEKIHLLPGMFARLSIELASVPDAVTVPAEAVVVTAKGGRAAFVIQDGKAVQRKVTTGMEEEGRIQILSGVREGELLIVAGNEKLKDGMPVRFPENGKEGGAPK